MASQPPLQNEVIVEVTVQIDRQPAPEPTSGLTPDPAPQPDPQLAPKFVKPESHTVPLDKYIQPHLPPAPLEIDWTMGVTEWGAMLNDKYGDCTIAAAAHAVQVWSLNTGGEVTIPDEQVLSYYQLWDGYNPEDPTSDKGNAPMTALLAWQNSDLLAHKLLAFADLDFTQLDQVRLAVALFGGVYAGFKLPQTARHQIIWDVDPSAGDLANPSSWGGHAAYIVKYDQHSFTCITWGKLKTMTLNFWQRYADEAHALLSPDWIAAKGAPSGFDLDQLQADLELLHHG